MELFVACRGVPRDVVCRCVAMSHQSRICETILSSRRNSFMKIDHETAQTLDSTSDREEMSGQEIEFVCV